MSQSLIFGFDLGVASIGWAVVRDDEIVASGVRIFDPGVAGSANEIAAGKDQPKATARRLARMQRRQLWRRAFRRRQILRQLVSMDLLPAINYDDSADIDRQLKSLDAHLRLKWTSESDHRSQQNLHYRLRAVAVSEKLERHELGRALLHLAQRRGFLSNRRTPRKQGEEQGQVLQAISELGEAIAQSKPPTLGGFLACLDPDLHRLRARWTARAMYIEEFEAIWRQQAPIHGLTDDDKQRLKRAIFRQRPLRAQSHLVGACSLLPDKRRGTIANRIIQRWRAEQQLSAVMIETADGTQRSLSPDERDLLRLHQRREGDLTIAKVKSLLGLKKAAVNIDRGEETRVIGHRTDAELYEAIGPKWEAMDDASKDLLLQDLRSFRSPEALARRLKAKWKLNHAEVEAAKMVDLEEGYANVSVAGAAMMLPLLESGKTYGEARKLLFPEQFRPRAAVDQVPPLPQSGIEVLNPAVNRTLAELRLVVNGLVRRYGKPDRIRLEMARDLKNSRDRRSKMEQEIKKRERMRSDIRARIVKECGIVSPRRSDIEKVLLAEECDWTCPYSGRAISMESLLGSQPQFDIEHIYPFSRSLDDSMLNKTLCHHETNRQRKRAKLPTEAFAGDPEQYQQILARVARFKADPWTRQEKLRRFKAEEIPAGFTNRHLAETRYISKAAADYLSLLYGGRVDDDGLRVEVVTGGLTAWLRRSWQLDGVVSEAAGLPIDDETAKDRSDHRHHAVDAMVIALTDRRAVQLLQSAAARSEKAGRFRPFTDPECPITDLRRRVVALTKAIVVSHRQSRRVRGKLHADSLYSAPIHGSRRISKEIESLSPGDVEKIIDPRARALVQARLLELGEPNPSKAFADPTNRPLIPGERPTTLRRVRVEHVGAPRTIGTADRARHVGSTQGSNHHMVLWARRDSDGNVIAVQMQPPVSLLDAYDRKRRGQEIVDRTAKEGWQFWFSLAVNDTIELGAKTAKSGRFVGRVKNISAGDIEVVSVAKALIDKQERDRITSNKAFLERRVRKVSVSPVGEVFSAGG